jgi:hypothetical protein
VPWCIYVSCQNRAVQCITTCAVQFSTEQCKFYAVNYITLHYITVQYSTVPAGMISMGFVTLLASSLLGLENIHPKGNRKHGDEREREVRGIARRWW